MDFINIDLIQLLIDNLIIDGQTAMISILPYLSGLIAIFLSFKIFKFIVEWDRRTL